MKSLIKLGFTKHGFEAEEAWEDTKRIASRLDDLAFAATGNIIRNKQMIKLKKAKEKFASTSYGMTENAGPMLMITELTPDVTQDLTQEPMDAPKGEPGKVFTRATTQNEAILQRLNRMTTPRNRAILENYTDTHLTKTQQP